MLTKTNLKQDKTLTPEMIKKLKQAKVSKTKSDNVVLK